MICLAVIVVWYPLLKESRSPTKCRLEAVSNVKQNTSPNVAKKSTSDWCLIAIMAIPYSLLPLPLYNVTHTLLANICYLIRYVLLTAVISCLLFKEIYCSLFLILINLNTDNNTVRSSFLAFSGDDDG